MKKTAIIVAGGTGSRIHSETPKQFIPIGGVPMLAYSIKTFHKYDAEIEIIVAINPDFSDQWEMLSKQSHINNIPIKIVHGGKERFYSVQNALNAVNHTAGLVAIHDAARPFVSELLIEKLFNHAEKAGSAIPAIPIKDSVRAHVMDEWVVADRTLFRAIQTPQVFDIEKLKIAYHQSYESKFTDDASVFESAGNKIYLIDGEENNFKITTEKDIDYAEYLAR
jgi:2-C-methyl-D-erythritol 4-phosphate cytidylyltransferase